MTEEITARTAFLLIVTVLLIAGCGAPDIAPGTPTQGAPQPFSARAESEDGAIVAWSGYTEGYEPGARAEFDVTITNETDGTWRGRWCLQLLARQSHRVVTTLEQREFALERGVGFSDTITVRFPENLDHGAYGLSLAVRRPAGPMVDLIPIQIGATEEVRGPTTQADMDASLEACPPVEGGTGQPETLVTLAKADLARRIGITLDEVGVQSVEPTEFPDASLGVPEPSEMYAQVVTPGYVIELVAQRQVYLYHGSGDRVVAVFDDEGQPSTGHIKIEGVQVTDEAVAVSGQSNLPDGTCLGTELWADGESQPWWPSAACVRVEDGAWQIAVRLGAGEVPDELDRSAQYMVRPYQQGGPDVVAVLAFDLSGPPTAEP